MRTRLQSFSIRPSPFLFLPLYLHAFEWQTSLTAFGATWDLMRWRALLALCAFPQLVPYGLSNHADADRLVGALPPVPLSLRARSGRRRCCQAANNFPKTLILALIQLSVLLVFSPLTGLFGYSFHLGFVKWMWTLLFII